MMLQSQCKICGMDCSDFTWFSKHLADHNQEETKNNITKSGFCLECETICETPLQVYQHYEECHDLRNQPYYKCDFCDFCHTQQKKVRDHSIATHKNDDSDQDFNDFEDSQWDILTKYLIF